LKSLILASNNRHKISEFNNIFENKLKLLTLNDIGFEKDIIENGDSFIGNALIKCKTIYDYCKKPVLSDDSGLCVDALGGAPGILSARYGNKILTDKERYTLLLKNLEDKSDYSAQFVCALVLYINPNRIYVVQEELKGSIISTPRGENGFGYDPIFYLKDIDKNLAELFKEEKNKISHRAKSSKVMKDIIFSIEF